MLHSKLLIALRVSVFFILLSLCIIGLKVIAPDTSFNTIQYPLTLLEDTEITSDLILVGSSTTYTSFSPVEFEKKTGLKSLNLSSQVQCMRESYEIVKMIFENENPKYIVISLGYGRMTTPTDEEGRRVILSSMNNSFERFKYFITEFDIKDIPSYFRIDSKSLKISNLYNIGQIKYYINERILNKYTTNGYSDDKDLQSGFLFLDSKFDFNTIPEEWDFKKNKEAIKYVNKMIELSQSKGSEVILLTPPIAPIQLYASENYDQYQEVINEIANKYGVVHFDLNLLKKEYIDYTDDLFGDTMHTNGTGGLIYSNLFGEIFAQFKNINYTNEEYFYSNRSECILDRNLNESYK